MGKSPLLSFWRQAPARLRDMGLFLREPPILARLHRGVARASSSRDETQNLSR